MKKEDRQTTRREMLKNAAMGVGLFVAGQQNCPGQLGTLRGQPLPISRDNPAIRHLKHHCMECGRCRGFCHDVSTVFGHSVADAALTDDDLWSTGDEDVCTHCGQCTLYCRAEALAERQHYPSVLRALPDRNRIVVASTSPAIRVALGELFGMEPGTNVEGKTVGALKKLGADYVLDTTFAADLTVMEEASELIERLERKKTLPMFSSCCPAWVRFARFFYPKLLPLLSTTKSPVLMQGAMVKSYFARKRGIDPENIFHVALTPCTAKKGEILLPGMNAAGVALGKPALRDVDVALTTRELALMLRSTKTSLMRMTETPYDSLMGAGSGAGMIFGNTGGVTEAVLRSAYRLLNEKDPPKEFYELKPVRGLRGVRGATVDLGLRSLNVVQIHGLGFFRPFLEAAQNGEVKVDFVELMACPGGCIGGGGQPNDFGAEPERVRRLRREGLYRHDAGMSLRLSCDNPEIKAIYDDFLGKPLGDTSKKMLHVVRS